MRSSVGPRLCIVCALVGLAMLSSCGRRSARVVAAPSELLRFADPVELTADSSPTRAITYPSPTFHDLDGDDVRELVVGDRFGRITIREFVGGDADSAWTANAMRSVTGKPLKLTNWCCTGMSLQFVDFDGDGHRDIVTATFGGTVFLVRGAADGWKRPEQLRDSQGRPIVLSLYYDTETHRFANADRSPPGVTHPRDHGVSATAMDWDDDGDYDLLLGARSGRLYLQLNQGAPGVPEFSGVNTQLVAGRYPLEVPGGLTAARDVDWDGDGLVDLVCGSFQGGAYLYRNSGEPGAPAFDAPVALLAPDGTRPADERGPDTAWYVDPVDYDGDGTLDLLVGGNKRITPPPRVLDDAEKARLSEVFQELREIGAEMNEMYIRIRREAKEQPRLPSRAYQRLYATETYRVLSRRWQALRDEQADLRGMPQRFSGVWLYRQAPPG